MSLELLPSTQMGSGLIELLINHERTTKWDFEDDCDRMLEIAIESNTEDEFVADVTDYLRRYVEDGMAILQKIQEASSDVLELIKSIAAELSIPIVECTSKLVTLRISDESRTFDLNIDPHWDLVDS